MNVDSDDFNYALEEADKLKEIPGLSYAQKLRLDWLPNVNSENESQIVANLLTHTPSFNMATHALITYFITDEERKAVHNCYCRLFDSAHSTDNVAELGKLLSLAAY